MNDSDALLILLLAKAGGSVTYTERELAAAQHGWRLVRVVNPVTGETTLRLVEC